MSAPTWTIVGRGIVGLAVAYRLARAGFAVTVIGQRNEGDVASLAALGNYSAKGLVVASDNLLAARLDGQRWTERLARELEGVTGIAIPKITGIYETFGSSLELKILRQRIYHNRFTGLTETRILSRDDFKDENRFLCDYAASGSENGALYFPNDFWLDPLALLAGLEAGFQKFGGRLINDSVRSVRPTVKGFWEISVASGSLISNEVMIASGAGTSDLLERSKLPNFGFLTSPGSTFVAQGPGEYSVALAQGRKGLVLFQGQLRLGSLDGPLPGQIRCIADLCRDKRHSEPAFAMGERYLKAMNLEAADLHEIRGVRIQSKDRLPVFGFISIPGLKNSKQRLWLGTAFHKVGFYLADFCAQNLINLLSLRSVDPFFLTLSPTRLLSSSFCSI